MTRRKTREVQGGDDWEMVVHHLARAFPYPPTPDLAGRVEEGLLTRPARRAARRRTAWVALIVLLALGVLLAVPKVRASVLHFLRIGAIQINLDHEQRPAPATLPPLAIPGAPGAQLAGETTLDNVREQVDFPIRLPAYPRDLGAPKHVYLQDFGGPLVVLVWVEKADPSRARLSLHILGPGVVAMKGAPQIIAQTTVHRQPALWTEGPYMLIYSPHGANMAELVEGHVLLWEEDGLTYRLETDLSLEEARRIAESLQ
jgi:hypothetical protein